MKISIITLFPEMFKGPFDHSIIKHAQEKNLVEIEYINLRDFGIGKHKVVDDTPYGGGIGMVLRVDVIHKAILHTRCKVQSARCKEKTILLSASGKIFKQASAKEYSYLDHIILICGHYEGIDARVSQFIDEEISVGEFVTTGGEIPAALIIDTVVRLIPGVLKEGVTDNESFSYNHNDEMLLEYPQYTRPQDYEKSKVPEVLLSGNHALIEAWRKNESIKKTGGIKS